MAEKRIALLGIIVEDLDSTEKINAILHECRDSIIGRMGIPYRQAGVSIISIVLNADCDLLSSLSGKLGMLPGVSVKSICSKQPVCDCQ